MTNEEAIVVLQKIKPIPHRGDSKSTTHILETIALDMAIKALEAQPCEDCISRQAVKETIFVQGSAEILEIDFAKLLLLQRAIKALPSVTPNTKTGK